jgi:hypothetical protein
VTSSPAVVRYNNFPRITLIKPSNIDGLLGDELNIENKK